MSEKNTKGDIQDAESLFRENLEKSFGDIDPSARDLALEQSMPEQGSRLFSVFAGEFKEFFGSNMKIFSIEEELYESVQDADGNDIGLKFKGFIDMVLKDSQGNYHIIDWKTCSWGWDAKKKSDPMNTYQLVYYKQYFSKKHSIPLQNIEVYFGLLKRTAKKNLVEIFKVTSGPRRVSNASVFLEKVVHNISNKNFIKNRLSCSRCEYYNTEHCN